LLVADFCAAAVLISFGAVIGKATLSQLIVMATVEVVFQSLNEFICVRYLKVFLIKFLKLILDISEFRLN
jgi:ammonium transporter Rh